MTPLVFLLGCAVLSLVFVFMGATTAVAYYISRTGGSVGMGEDGDTASVGGGACGEGVETLVSGFDMLLSKRGKLGHEEHLKNTKPSHYCGSDSGDCGAIVYTGFVNPHTTDQERWYFNSRWGGWLDDGRRFDTRQGASEARNKIHHARLIITSEETGKSMVVSAEEYGPGERITNRDGIWYGAPPEVYKYLGGKNPYTGNPNDGHSSIKVAFAKDQNAELGPCN